MPGILAALIFCTAFLDLHPTPQHVLLQQRGVFALDSTLPLVVDDHATREDLEPLEPLFEALRFRPQMAPASTFRTGSTAIYIGVVGKHQAFDHRAMRRYIPDPARLGEGAYHLYIWRNGIVVAGTDRQGMIHGIQTLTQLVRESQRQQIVHRGRPAVPFTEIRDYPDLDLRGAYVRGPVTKAQIQAFSALKCNLLIFESDDFYDMNDERAALWRAIFHDARVAGITPVPVFQFFDVPAALLRKAPAAVEGRSRIDRLSLSDEDWASLTRRHVIYTPENPMRVTMGTSPLRLRQDFLVSEGTLEVPFSPEYAHPWMLRRVPGGGIPRGTSVEVTYSYAPPGSGALCPNAPETRLLLRNALERLVRDLAPEYVHCGFGDIGRLNQDLRCRATGKSNSELFTEALSMMHGMLTEANRNVRLIIWADALLPPESEADDSTSLHHALNTLPGNVLMIPRFQESSLTSGTRVERTLNFLAERQAPVIAATAGSAPALYQTVKRIADYDEQRTGIILFDADPRGLAAQTALAKAWSVDSPMLLWPEVLNSYLQAALWEPTFDETKEVLIQFVERQLLSGVPPADLREGFTKHIAPYRRDQQLNQDELNQVSGYFDLITRFVELEYEYASGNARTALRELPNLVRRFGELDPTMDAERIDRIQATIKNQGLFVPASILLGRSLTYYRPFQIPRNAVPCEASARLEYADEPGRAQAIFDFLVSCGPIFRIDFETMNARAVTLHGSDDGLSYERIEVRPTLAEGGLRGPLLLSNAVSKRFLRLQIESHGDQAVLREVRAFVLKQPPQTQCPMIASPPATGGTFDAGRHVGMLFADAATLATAPTEIRIFRDSRFLNINVIARDPIPHAMSAVMTGVDAPLWEEESVEVRIRSKNRSARRFLVNPLGARYDAMAVAGNLDAWDPGWDGDWSVRVEQTESGWNAAIIIPFSILGGAVQSGDTWEMTFLRHRHNVERETSEWALPDSVNRSGYGTVVFE